MDDNRVHEANIDAYAYYGIIVAGNYGEYNKLPQPANIA
jgi:hypothetical protein